jgi:hypothetical protein
MMKKIVHALGLRPMARTLPVCHTACEVLTAFLALCWPAAAEEKQSVRIHIQYSTYAERVRPFPFSATVSQDITAILSGKNTIQDGKRHLGFSMSGSRHARARTRRTISRLRCTRNPKRS